ncbi:MAG: hypothetical protein IPM18_01780 [Phycisphaerales bacterium]|nr:hypothetical protein [Phycisphaerales bacterium]
MTDSDRGDDVWGYVYDPVGNRVTHERQYRDDQDQLVQLAIGYVANALNQYETAAISGR